MVPEVINFDPITKGNTFPAKTFFLSTGTTGATTPLNLTGYTIDIVFRAHAEGIALKKLSIGDGIILSNPTNGEFIVEKISPCDFPVGNILYDIKVKDSNDDIITYIKGVQPILQNIS